MPVIEVNYNLWQMKLTIIDEKLSYTLIFHILTGLALLNKHYYNKLMKQVIHYISCYN